jgi:tRNA threonylcarbamoyladenosine biosynthesis protein TsaE
MQHFTAHLHDEEAQPPWARAGARHGAAWRSTCTATWGPAKPPPRALLRAGHTGTVKSPTYTLSEPYSIRSTAGRQRDPLRPVPHGQPGRFLDAGFREDFNGDNICIVEWPEKADGVLPADLMST